MSDEPSDNSSASDDVSSVDPQSIEGLFLTALAKKDRSERTDFLNEVCAGDPDKRQRIEALLRAYNDAGSFFEKSPLAMPTVIDEENFDFLESSDDPSLLGALGPYDVYEMIGRGGMGIVFRALDPKLNRVVAVKVLAPELAVNANAKRRFVREARAGAAINHPHVVTIHAVDDEEKLPFLVMECIVGQSLQQKIDKVGSLRLIETVRISKQIAEGLAAAHHQGLIHRDIKPANIMLENGVERVKITDFGLARAIDDVSVTRTGEVAGSPQFMSPEQALGEKVDQRSDLFSLGCVMYAMCAGRSPFRATSIAASIRRVCDDEPRSLAEINPEVPEWMISIIQNLLQKNPEKRIQSSDEVVQVLEAHLAGNRNARSPSETTPTAQFNAISPQPATASGQPSATTQEDVSILDLLSSSFMRLAILGPLITLLLCFLWALMPEQISSRHVPYMLVLIGPALWGAALVGWLGSHVDHVEWGQEAYYKGRIATVLAFLTPPLWILGIPTALIATWSLRHPAVFDLYKNRESGRSISLPLPESLLNAGVLFGAMLMSLASLLIFHDHRFTYTDVLEALPAFLCVIVLVLPLRGRVYRGRFWTDFAISLSAFSIVASLFWMFHPERSHVGIHSTIEVIMVVLFWGVTIGLPALFLWKHVIKLWFDQSVSEKMGDKRSRARNIRAIVGLMLLLAVASLQVISRMTATPPMSTPASVDPVEEIKQEPLVVPVPLVDPIDVNDLIGTWVVKGTEDTSESETIKIEQVVKNPPVGDGEFSRGLRLSFTDVSGNLQEGLLSLSLRKNLFSLLIRQEEQSRQEWHGNFELVRDELSLVFQGVNVTGLRRTPIDWSQIQELEFSPRRIRGTYHRLVESDVE